MIPITAVYSAILKFLHVAPAAFGASIGPSLPALTLNGRAIGCPPDFSNQPLREGCPFDPFHEPVSLYDERVSLYDEGVSLRDESVSLCDENFSLGGQICQL